MGEFAGDQVGDGDQVLGGAVTAGLGLGGLDQRVGPLDAAVGEFGVEGIEDAGPVVLEGLGDLFDGFEAAATSPGVPLVQERLGVLAVGGAVGDLAQALLDAEGAVSLEVELFEVGELGDQKKPSSRFARFGPPEALKRANRTPSRAPEPSALLKFAYTSAYTRGATKKKGLPVSR